MDLRATLRVLGGLLVFLGIALLAPIPFSLWFRDGQAIAFVLSACVSASVGAGLLFSYRSERGIGFREGFAIVTLGWLSYAIFGSLPFLFSGAIPSPIDAFFESMSGFTTTGASVIRDFDAVPESIFFWRATTHWLGGMGIIVLSLAILPFLRVGGMQLFDAEAPGPTTDRLFPRIQTTAKVLWGVYFLFTFAEVLLLLLGGMGFYEAVCHSFATMATGGFSTESASIGAYPSLFIRWTVTFFMLLAGISFSLHLLALRGRVRAYWRSEEFRFYLGTLLAASAIIFLFNRSLYDGIHANACDSAFTVVSIATTTGFCTADYENWHVLAQYVLVVLMFFGGCAGSTGGGIKNARILLIIKQAYVQVFRLIHPRGVRVLKLDHKPVPDEIVRSVLGFFALYIGIFVAASLAMAALGLDLVTAGGAVVACLSNIGPGLGEVGPAGHYGEIGGAGKTILSICMLLGRLEILTVLVLFFPSFWRK